MEEWGAGGRAVRSGAGGGVFWGEYVSPAARCEQGGAGAPRAATAGTGLRTAGQPGVDGTSTAVWVCQYSGRGILETTRPRLEEDAVVWVRNCWLLVVREDLNPLTTHSDFYFSAGSIVTVRPLLSNWSL